MATGNVADCISHCQHSQAESKRDAYETDSELCASIQVLRRKHCAAASAKYQPESADKLRCRSFRDWHDNLLSIRSDFQGRCVESNTPYRQKSHAQIESVHRR